MSQTSASNGTNGTTTGTGGAARTLELRSHVAPANDVGEDQPRADRPGPFGLSRTYWTLWAGMLLNRMGGCVFFLLSVYLTRERGMTAELAGLVISLYAAGGLLAGPLGGAFADRAGRRAALLTGTTCAGLLMLALGFARSTGAIVAVAPALGFFTTLAHPALQAAVADVVPAADRTRAYGILYWAVNLGFAGASALGGLLAERHFTLLFVIDALTTLAYGAIVLVAVPETRPALAPGAPRPRHAAALLTPLRDGGFMRFVFIQVLLLTAFAQVITALPLDMRAHGMGLSKIGWLLGLNGIYIVIAQPLVLRWVRGYSHVQWLAAGAALTGLGLGATALASGVLGYVLTGIVWTLGEIGFSTGGPALVAEFAPVDKRGAYQGTYQLAWGFASTFAPALGALVLARLGASALWLCCLVMCLAASALHLRVTARRARAG